MPNRKDIQWSQLKVGALALVATAILIGLIFLMSGSTGGLFSRKLKLRCYFANAAGLKDGAPVALEGVTIGNVIHVRVVPARNPKPVEVTMQVGYEYRDDLHANTTATINQAGVLGDSYVDLSSAKASGPPPNDGAELPAGGAPSIQDVIRTSNDSIEQLQDLMKKVGTLVDTLNSKKGSAGMFLNDREFYEKITGIATNLKTITDTVAAGNGSIGKLIYDDTLYTRVDSAVDKLDKIASDIDAGKGNAGKFLHDETLFNHLNAAAKNLDQLTADINAGKGSIGKIAKDEAFAQRLDDAVTRLDDILKGVDEGKGSVGQLFQNRSLYDNADKTMQETKQLVQAIRQDPKKYLVIRLKLF